MKYREAKKIEIGDLIRVGYAGGGRDLVVTGKLETSPPRPSIFFNAHDFNWEYQRIDFIPHHRRVRRIIWKNVPIGG